MTLTTEKLQLSIAREYIASIARDEGIADYVMDVSLGSKAGDNMIGHLQRVILRGVDRQGRAKTLSVIVKKSSGPGAARDAIPTNAMFEREIFVYERVLTEFRQFQHEKNITYSEGFFNYPKYYIGSSSNENEFLIISDLFPEQFQILPKKEPIDFRHASKILEYLARYHALSFAMKHQKPERFAALAAKCQEIIVSGLTINDDYRAVCDGVAQKVLATLDAEKDRETWTKLKTFCENMIKNLIELSEVHKRGEEFCVISYGDVWTNNLFFKYDSKKSEIIDVAFIDFQVTHVTSPILDVSLFIYNMTDCQKLTQDFDKYLNVYYNELSRFLKRLGSDPELVFPRSAFDQSWLKYGKNGVLTCTYMTPIILNESKEDIRDFGPEKAQNEFLNAMTCNEDKYKEKISSIVKHAASKNFI